MLWHLSVLQIGQSILANPLLNLVRRASYCALLYFLPHLAQIQIVSVGDIADLQNHITTDKLLRQQLESYMLEVVGEVSDTDCILSAGGNVSYSGSIIERFFLSDDDEIRDT